MNKNHFDAENSEELLLQERGVRGCRRVLRASAWKLLILWSPA